MASLLLLGIVILGFGLDWDQSQITGRAKASVPLIVTGSVLFTVGFTLLCVNPWPKQK